MNKANTSDIEALFLDIHLSISNGFVSSKIYDNKRDDFDFDCEFSLFGRGRCLSYNIPLMECIFHNLLGLLECVVMWMTSMLVLNV